MCFLLLAILLFVSDSSPLFAKVQPINESQAGENQSQKNQAGKQNLTVVVVKNFPPHYSVDETGQPQGFAIDVIEAIARDADIEITFLIKDSWTQTAAALKTGEADLIPNLGITDARKIDFDFSKPVEFYPIVIIVRAGTKNIRTLDNLYGKQVGVVKFNVGEKIVNNAPEIKVQRYEQPEAALIALLSGQVDALVYPKSVMLKVARDIGIEEHIEIAGKPLKEIKRAIAVRKGNIELLSRLNVSVERFLKSGQYKDVYVKWYGKPTPFWTVSNVIFFAGILLFVVIIIFSLWRYYTLSRINSQLVRTDQERKQAVAALEKSSVLLRNVLDSTPDLIFVKNEKLQTILCNKACAMAVGKTPKEMYGHTDVENGWDPELVYGNPDKGIRGFEQDDRKALAGHTVHNPSDPANVEGQIRVFDTHKLPLRDAAGKIIGMLGIARDITERKQSEEKIKHQQQELQQILDTVVDGIITINEVGIILTFNASAEILFGYSAKDVIGHNVSMLMPESYADHHDEYLQKYLKTGEARIIGIGREVEAVRKDKSIFPMRLSIAELPVDLAGQRRFIGSCQDLTLIREQAEQLHRSQKMDALGKLTGGIAHDYNNMLGVILGYADLLKGLLQEQPKPSKYVEEIYHAGKRGEKLTQKLLSFSRQKESTAVKININNLLLEQQHMLEKTLTVRIHLMLELQEDLWLTCIDTGDFEDAILNLSINAMHAIDGNGELIFRSYNLNKESLPPELSRSELSSPEFSEYVALSIADTGCGMDATVKEKIFDPFFSTKGEKGSGLGLSQVYGFVERSGGAIKVYSVPDQGTQFVLYFPRCVDVDNEKREQQENSLKDLSGDETILIVDDEPALLKLTRMILEEHGYKILSAENANQALDVLNTESVDLLLSDVIMPGMDGYQLAARVRERYPDIKIQLASGFSDDRHLDTTASDLHQFLLHKPFKAELLLARIRTLLDN